MTVPGAVLNHARPSSPGHAPDVESLGWLRELSSTGPERDGAVERLHELLLLAARAEVARRRAGADIGERELDDLAVQAADDALVAVLGKLHTYRGDGRCSSATTDPRMPSTPSRARAPCWPPGARWCSRCGSRPPWTASSVIGVAPPAGKNSRAPDANLV